MTDRSLILEAMRTARIDTDAIAKALREEMAATNEAMSARISECYKLVEKIMRTQERLFEQIEAVGRELEEIRSHDSKRTPREASRVG